MEAKKDEKGPKIEGLEQRLVCPINRSQTPNTIKIGIAKKNLKLLDKKGLKQRAQNPGMHAVLRHLTKKQRFQRHTPNSLKTLYK